ncbi:MAG: 4-hydroxy-3-methylbut-2-enyl diphosphate reductase [Actinobacteria bacterium]|nr:4-hydroxy-3-methylbut-2-enyl diphosphate reductase [Actinomycetota bacterium]
MQVIIDKNAGVCPGVDRAIHIIEDVLEENRSITALGPIIHNRYEIDRLSQLGMKTREQSTLEKNDEFEPLRKEKLFIRTHGIPKRNYEKLKAEHLNVIDGTCPIVRRLQKRVEHYYENGYQIVIVGKAKHPEVIGLLGHCDDTGIVILDEFDFDKIDFSKKSVLVSQTTISQQKFFEIKEKLSPLMNDLEIVDTTCKHINKRHDHLMEFSKNVDVVLVVGGKTSSNTGVLYEICSQANSRSYRIESAGEIRLNWFHEEDIVGITGGTSTPNWQLELVRDYLQKYSPLRGFNK